MSVTVSSASFEQVDEATYRRRQRAWVMYDWANSAFATTILAAVLPAYYSEVAGATLPSEATATGYWSLTLSIGLFIVAILSPILGTISDVRRGKKAFLSLFVTIGVIGTGLLVFVGTGDWVLASILFIIGRVGFSASIIFYDALLPHVARSDDVDRLSTTGYAIGYLGGGLLLAVNLVMIFVFGSELGARLSFLSVAIWWAVFSIPVLRVVPEPPAATAALGPGENVLSVSLKRLRQTFRDLRQYRELLKFLIAFLIYNDGIGTIIGIAVIYGAELGLGTLSLVGALLLVQFVGIPFSFIFGRLPAAGDPRRAFFLAFILWNLVLLPIGAVGARSALDTDLTGAPQPDTPTIDGAVGTGVVALDDAATVQRGLFAESATEVLPAPDEVWQAAAVEDAAFDGEALTYLSTEIPDAAYSLRFNGQSVALFYSKGPDRGIFQVYLDGVPYDFGDDELEIGEVDAYRQTVRWNNRLTIEADEAGVHTLVVRNTGRAHPDATGTRIDVGRLEVLPPPRVASLPLILGLLAAIELSGLLFAWAIGQRLVAGLAESLDTKRSVLLALVIYMVIAVFGYFIDSVVEFWLLAWLVAIVQGGSQALSRSLYASMSPRAKSGEFFGFFSVMEKFAGILGPILFAAVVALSGSSRPAVLSLIVLFVIGGWLLTRVDVEAGRRVAREEDAALEAQGAVTGR